MLVDFRDFIGVIGMGAKPLSGEWSSAHAGAIFSFFSLFSRGRHSIFPAFFGFSVFFVLWYWRLDSFSGVMV